MPSVTEIAWIWRVPTTAGVVSVLAGAIAVALPDLTLLAVALLFGANLIVTGASSIVTAVTGDETGSDRGLHTALGLVGAIAGLLVLRRPGDALLVLVLSVGFWLVLEGSVRVIGVLALRAPHAGVLILSGIADVALGATIIAWPDISLRTFAVLAGFALIVRGVRLVADGRRLRENLKHPPQPASVT